MAKYEYGCELDGVKEEVFPIGTAPETIRCGICGDKMKRNYNSFGLVFRGTGWGKDA
jgi:predicted nucleic acid-binding Zn ribbon protein